jgi:hypothetical protein
MLTSKQGKTLALSNLLHVIFSSDLLLFELAVDSDKLILKEDKFLGNARNYATKLLSRFMKTKFLEKLYGIGIIFLVCVWSRFPTPKST